MSNRSSHRILVPTLVVLGLFCVMLATVSSWLHDSALDSSQWEDQSGQLLRSPNVRSALAAYVVDQAITQTNAAAAIQQQLPPALKPFSAPATAALERLATQGTEEALTLPRIQLLWMEANRRAHDRLVAFLKGDTTRLTASNGSVELNLDTIIADVAASLGAGPDVVARAQQVPPVTIISSHQLSAVQTGVQWLQVLSIWPIFLGLALIAGAVYLARGRRREAVRMTAIGFVLVGIFLLVVRRIAGQEVVNSLVQVDSVKPAAHDAWDIYTELLKESAVAGVAMGLLAWAGTILAGPTRWAVELRARLAPTFAEHPLAPHVALAGIAMLILLVQPAGTPRRAIGIVLITTLAFVGLEVFRRQTVREFAPVQAIPDGPVDPAPVERPPTPTAGG